MRLSLASAVQPSTVQESQLATKWDDYLLAYGRDRVMEAALAWPDVASVVFDFQEIQLRDPDLANHLLKRPMHALAILRSRVRELEMPVADPKPDLHVRICNLPKSLRMGPRQVRASNQGELVAVYGVITATSNSLLDLVEGVFECKVCSTRAHVLQEDDTRLEPILCEACDKPQPWRFLEGESKNVDAQYLRLQEPPELVKGGATPEIVGVRIHSDLVHLFSPGSRVIVTGIVTTKPKRIHGKVQNESEPAILGLHIQPDESELVDLETSPEELQAFHELANRPTVHEELSRCLAPSVLGLTEIKMGILLSLAGGPEWNRPDGSKVRGRIHILIAGDPGTAKSKLMGRMGRYTPRCVPVLGVEASKAGLSVAAVKDADGRWMLEAGALVMAHQHVMTMDELGHLDQDDQPSMLSSMEDGYVKCDRVVRATLPAEATIIAAMNPTNGRFDRYSPFMEQLGVSAPLKSRFDLKFCLLDRVDRAADNDLADSLLADSDRDVRDEKDHYGVVLSGDELRRYIYQAKKIDPRITEEAIAHLKEYYGRIRSQDPENPAFQPRQLEALRRIAGASARLRLSHTIDLQDAERAVHLMASSLRSCGIMDNSGHLDGDLLQFGQSKSQYDRVRLVQQTVKDLQRAHPDGYNRGWAKEAEVLASCVERGIADDLCLEALKTLVRNGIIYERHGRGTYAILT